MAEKRISGNLIVGLLFVFIIASLLVFGGRLTGYAVSEGGGNKLDIQIDNNYIPGEDVVFKIVLYDAGNNKIEGDIDYVVQNYYTEVIEEGVVGSGEEVSFRLSEDAVQGPWKISAKYNEIEINRLFNVGDLEKAKINLEGDILTVKNIGNSVYNKKILIYIGDVDQTADITLEIGQTKKIRLTAPDGDYDIQVIEGNEEQTLEFKGVRLTGNVVSLERVLVADSFWRKYPMVIVFFGAVVLIAGIIGFLKVINKEP